MRYFKIITFAWMILLSACASATDPGLDKRYNVEIDSVAQLAGLKFHWTTMPVKIQYNACAITGCSAEIEASVKAGLEFWRKNAALYGEIQTVYGSPGDIVVSYVSKIGGNVIAKCGASNAVQFTATGKWSLVVPMAMTIGLATDFRPILASEFELVSAHELGHCLGLFPHSSTEGDLMFSTLTDKMTYSSRDLNSIRYLYAQTTDIGTYPASLLKNVSNELVVSGIELTGPPLDPH